VVEEEPYFLELVRYIHLNPLRGQVVKDLRDLDDYGWSGHAALVGRRPLPWQDTQTVLARFAPTVRIARRRYRSFVAEGMAQGRRPDLQGGGLRRSAGGWGGIAALRRGRERWASDERILGSGPFVEAVRREAAPPPGAHARAASRAALPEVCARCAKLWGVKPEELTGGGRRRAVAHARAVVSGVAVRELGLPIAEVAHMLGISPTGVRKGVARLDALLAVRRIRVEDLVSKKVR
jgi:hypothetical protein